MLWFLCSYVYFIHDMKKHLLNSFYCRQLGTISSKTTFSSFCLVNINLSRLFAWQTRNGDIADFYKSSVIAGFLHCPVDYPVLVTLWYFPMSWIGSLVRLVLFDFLHRRKAVMALTLDSGLSCSDLKIDIFQWHSSVTLSRYALARFFEECSNGDMLQREECHQIGVINLPELSNCINCQNPSRTFHWHKYCVKFPKTPIKNGRAHLYPWKLPSSSADSIAPFYDVVLSFTDASERCIEIGSVFKSNSIDFVNLMDQIQEEKLAAVPVDKLGKFVTLMTSMVIFVRRNDLSLLSLSRSCSHLRELKAPTVITEIEHELVPVCANCLFDNLTKHRCVDFELLMVGQAKLYFQEHDTMIENKSNNDSFNFGISVEGDCMLITYCDENNQCQSHSIIFNLLTFNIDCMIFNNRGLSLCFPTTLPEEPHIVSNRAFVSGRSLSRLEDRLRRFVLINDVNESLIGEEDEGDNEDDGSEPRPVSVSSLSSFEAAVDDDNQ